MHYITRRDLGKLNTMLINNEFNKVQVNETVDKDGNGNVIRRTLMINIRSNDVDEADRLYCQLKAKLNSKAAAGDKNKNAGDYENGNVPTCQCGRPMVLRQGRTGLFFYGCSGYPQCRLTREYNGSDGKEADEVIQDIQV